MNKRLGIIVTLAVVLFIIIFNRTSKLSEKILPEGNVSRNSVDLNNLDKISPQALQERPQVEISTSKGTLLVELRLDLSPNSVANFLANWNSGLCDGKTFHRVENWVVQGCDPKGDGTGGENTLKTETSSASFTRGSIGVARQPYPENLSNNIQFFILKRDAADLNGKYTYLGKVLTGMDVVDSLVVGDKIISVSLLSK